MLIVLAALHASLFVIAPILSTHVVAVGEVRFLGGMLAAAVGCGMLDLVNNAYGASKAQTVVVSSAVARAVCWVFLLALGPLKEALWIAVVGEGAMLTSALLLSIPVFQALRGKFWMRYSAANLASQTVAVAIISLVLCPNLFLGNWLAQVGTSMALTPVFGLLAKAVR